MSIENWSAPDEMLSCDACFLGMGAISKNQFFHTVFPEFLKKKYDYLYYFREKQRVTMTTIYLQILCLVLHRMK
jgi:hypothetical protein